MDSLARHVDYDGPRLDEAEFGDDPFARFAEWLDAAESAGIPDPNAMVLSTVDAGGAPSSRTVLLKSLDGDAFGFVTNGLSRKGAALAHEPRVALLFPWYALHRQVIVSGSAEPADAAASDAAWADRPRGSQLGAWASAQSQPVAGRAELERRADEAAERFADADAVPRPPHWGLWRVVPTRIEFWQGRPSRLHDRLLLSRVGVAWSVTRLQP
jgi:pyridoxamine 5'-phosphate oxidase